MPADISSIVLTIHERQILRRIKRGHRVPDSEARPLRDLGLCSPHAIVNTEDGGVIRNDWKITKDGLRYYAYRSEQRRKLIVNSVVLPIIVAIITSAITVYILPTVGRKATEWLRHRTHSTPQSQVTPVPTDGPPENP